MAAEPGRERTTSALTLALAAIGATSFELAICGMTLSISAALARAAVLSGAMIAAFLVLVRRREAIGDRVAALSHRETRILILLAVAPAVWHPARVAVGGGGVMLETILLEILRNLGLGLAALSGRPLAARLSAIVALFGVLVGSSLVEGHLMTTLAAGFAVLGAGWLLAGYWSGLPTRRGVVERPSLAGALAAVGVVGAVLVIASIGPTNAATALAGLVPTSGGTDWSDPEARSGVGDGPNEVDARDSADSVGFSQSEVYLETDQPSLYDAFNDTFGEPIKKTKQEKAIAIAPTDVQRREEHPHEDHRAGREFSTHRKPPPGRDPPAEEADALLYVRGRAPAHLRLVAYDTFDGHSWAEGPPTDAGSSIRAEGSGSPWLQVASAELPYLSGRVRHRVKVGRLDSRSIPAPAHLDRFRVGSVNRADFYEWAQPEVLRMNGRSIPPGTVIDTEARTAHPGKLRGLTIPERPNYALLRHCESPDCPPALAELAHSWTAGVPRGWGQVEAIVSRLRGHCEHDRSATPPEDCEDPVAHFLVDARKGPDYLFATAATLMLRSLGYPARVVGGLYVDPERFDPIARHVSVGTVNAHLWVEVQAPGGSWVAVEPTPGFSLMPPALSPLEHLIAGVTSAARWARSNAGALALAAIGLGLLIWRRREVLDRCWTLSWWVGTLRAGPGRAVIGTLRLVERRASWAGRARPPGLTPTRWCRPVVSAAPPRLGGDLRALVLLAERIAYAPGPIPVGPDDSRSLCRRVVRGWTLRAFRSPPHHARSAEEPAS